MKKINEHLNQPKTTSVNENNNFIEYDGEFEYVDKNDDDVDVEYDYDGDDENDDDDEADEIGADGDQW